MSSSFSYDTEGSEIIILFESIDTVVKGNKTDISLPKHLHDLSDLQIVTAQTGHVLRLLS